VHYVNIHLNLLTSHFDVYFLRQIKEKSENEVCEIGRLVTKHTDVTFRAKLRFFRSLFFFLFIKETNKSNNAHTYTVE